MKAEASSLYRSLQARRSIRRFEPEPVPDDVLQRVLQAGTRSPSAHNRQPWRFAVLRDAGARRRLASAMGTRLREDRLADGDDPELVEADVARSFRRISEAPVAILVCLTMEEMGPYPDEWRANAERVMAVQGTAMAGAFVQLAAHAEGLGACWLCAPLFAPQAASQALALPQRWEPQGLILLGYPASEGRKRPRRPVEEVSLWR
jgi:coenzyme F420-0:L-glutamate ligase/coenzyme F420-1:gamma-L-glutamate ligase